MKPTVLLYNFTDSKRKNEGAAGAYAAGIPFKGSEKGGVRAAGGRAGWCERTE